MLEFIMFVMVAMVAGIVAWGVYYLIETVNRKETSEMGVVCNLDFTPEHTILIYNAATKTPMPHFISDSWSINVKVEGKALDGVQCSKSCFNKFKIGDTVRASIRHGRLSGNKYLFGVETL